MVKNFSLGLAGAVLAVGVAYTVDRSHAASSLDGMAVPQYDEAGDMLRPEGYRGWTFVGTSLGLRYAEDGQPEDGGPGSFHNVYMQPEAYRHFVETGEFPEKTILAMETYSAGTREPRSGLTGGFFENELLGLSAAVKDVDRFPEGWGYLSFTGAKGGAMRSKASPFAKERCYDCHHEHGATDNVFTQFYPVLRR